MRRWLVIACVSAACYSEQDSDPVQTSEPGSTSTQAGESSSATTTVGTVSTDADTTSSTTDASSTGEPSCGNGMPDPDEDCDDGNDVPGDGCSSCRTSGSLLWVETAGTQGRRDECYGVALGEAVFAVGNLEEATDFHHAWLGRFERDAMVSWRFDHTDDTSSGFRAITVLDNGNLIAVGIRNNATLLVGDAWAKRFTSTGATGLDEELVWQAESGSAGFVDVATIGNDLVLAASLIVSAEGYQAWYGQQPLAQFPSTSFFAEAYSGGATIVPEMLDRGGKTQSVRALQRTVDPGGIDAIDLVAFEGAISQLPTESIALMGSDAPVAIAVDDGGGTWVCRGAPDSGDLVLEHHDAALEDGETVVRSLGGDVACHAIVAAGDRVLVAGSLDGTSPFVAELDAELEVAWQSAVDGEPGVVRSIALDEAGDVVALCGVRPDEADGGSTDALVALISR